MSTEQASTPPDGAPTSDEGPVDAVLYEEEVEPEYGILGFTLRELVIVGAWALAFIVSFFPVLGDGASVWTSGIDWILTIGVPTAAVFLIVLRRFSPEGIRRVGSLGIDQFASVAAAVAGVVWAQLLWHQISASIRLGAFLVGWVPIVALLAVLVLIVATVVAPLIPGLREDFEGRMETLAHRNADPVRPVIRRPRPAVVAEPETEQDTAESVAEETSPEEGPETADEPTDAESTDAEPTDDEPDADATRVIVLGPVVDAPPADAAIAASAAEAAAAAAAPDEPEHRPAGIAYTDPIGALDDIFEAKGTVIPGEPEPDDRPEPEFDSSPATDAEPLPEFGVRPADDPDSMPDPDSTPDSDQTEVIDDAEVIDVESDALLRRNRTERPRAFGQETQPFWILARTERDVLDERGQVLYRIGPTAWTLVIEDRDGAYVVRHDDGRIGYLHDLTDITKG